jgi:hypothetical protein
MDRIATSTKSFGGAIRIKIAIVVLSILKKIVGCKMLFHC